MTLLTSYPTFDDSRLLPKPTGRPRNQLIGLRLVFFLFGSTRATGYVDFGFIQVQIRRDWAFRRSNLWFGVWFCIVCPWFCVCYSWLQPKLTGFPWNQLGLIIQGYFLCFLKLREVFSAFSVFLKLFQASPFRLWGIIGYLQLVRRVLVSLWGIFWYLFPGSCGFFFLVVCYCFSVNNLTCLEDKQKTSASTKDVLSCVGTQDNYSLDICSGCPRSDLVGFVKSPPEPNRNSYRVQTEPGVDLEREKPIIQSITEITVMEQNPQKPLYNRYTLAWNKTLKAHFTTQNQLHSHRKRREISYS